MRSRNFRSLAYSPSWATVSHNIGQNKRSTSEILKECYIQLGLEIIHLFIQPHIVPLIRFDFN